MNDGCRVRQMVCVGVGIKRVAFLPINLGWKDSGQRSKNEIHRKLVTRWRSKLASTLLAW